MRTTLDIPDVLYRRLKAKAAAEGSSVKQIVLHSVERELRARSPKRRRITLPIIASKRPGTLQLTNRRIYENIAFP